MGTSVVYRGKSAAQRRDMRRRARRLMHSAILLSGPAGLDAWGLTISILSKTKHGGDVRIVGPCGSTALSYEFLGVRGYWLGNWLVPYIHVSRSLHPCLGFELDGHNIWWHEVTANGHGDLRELLAVSQGYFKDLYLIENGDVVQVRNDYGWLAATVRRKGSQVVEVLGLDTYLKQIRS